MAVAPVESVTKPKRRRETWGERRRRRRAISQTYWAREQSAIESSVSRHDRTTLLRHYGDFSLAYSTAVQPLLEYWGDESGYIAFRRRWGQTFALADPVAPPHRHGPLIQSFVERFKRPAFVHTSRETAKHLVQQGYLANQMGVDTRLELGDFHFRGRIREWLRYADNWIARRGYQVKECSPVDIRQATEQISEAWRRSRTIRRKEVRFINRPIVLEQERDVRHFYLFDPTGEIQAYVFFDPLYRNQQVVGYVTSIKRRGPLSPGYGDGAILKRAIEQFQREGRQVLYLGLSPLARINDGELPHNRLLQRELRYLHQAGWVNRFFYHYRGHAAYKRRFRGLEEPVFYCSPVRFNQFRLLTLSSLCGLF